VKAATSLHIRACCPHCGASMTDVATLTVGEQPVVGQSGDYFDNGHNRGEGGYVTGCESCGERFVITRELATDAQHACVVILGEA